MNQRNKEALLAITGFAFLMPFVASFFARQAPPSFIQIALEILPFLALGLVISIVVLLLVAKERGPQAAGYVMKVAAVACVVGCFASLTRVWNDGTYSTLLTPAWSLVSVLSLGLFPLKMGPIALLRFLPASFAAGIFWRVWKTRGRAVLAVSAALCVYLPFALSIHTLTWIGGAMSLSHTDALSSPADTYRVLVSAQADGYWTQAQTERFFAPIGMQNENGFYGVQAASIYLVLVILLVLLALRTIRSLSVVGKRLLSRSAILLALSALLGLGLGLLLQGGSISYTEGIACVVFFVCLIAWLGWWRLARDIAHLARDERDSPGLPLPSGAVSLTEAESLRDICVILALYGSFILGWPVLVSFACASLLTWIDLHAEWPGRVEVGCRALVAGLVAGCVGSAALAMAVSDAAEPQWMLRILLSAAVLIGLEKLFRSIDRVLPSRVWQAVVLSACIAIALFLANQQATWLLFLPAVAAIFILARTEEKWSEYRIFPLYFVLGALIFLATFVSQWLVKA